MDHPAPSVDHRPFGGREHFRSATELSRMAMNGGLIAAQIDLRGIGKVTFRLGHILGNVNQHRSRPPSAGNMKSFLDGPCQILHIADGCLTDAAPASEPALRSIP